jgi:hypothetical protein
MNWNRLLDKAKQIALRAVGREIERILAKADAIPGVKAEAADEGVILSGKKLKSRSVADPQVRDIAR